MKRVGLWWRVAGCVAVVAAVGLAATTTSGASPRAALRKSAKAVEAYVTYYGWYDNTPPGCATAYSGCAGGTGTYQDPITFASYKKEFPVGTLVYYPTVEKYFRMGDACQECRADWTGKGPDGGPRLHHLDLWIGGKGGNEFDVINCEDGLTQGMPNGSPLLTPLIVNPPAGLPTSTEPLFNPRTNRCFGGARTETSYGRYKNRKTGKCLEDEANSTASGSPAVAAPCGAAAGEDLAFDGAFFTVNHLCLATKGSKFGSRLDFVTCSGGPRQQWEIGSHGTIAWIQYLRCIADLQGTIELARCKISKTNGENQWTYVSEKAP